jgi:hypothetical protein
MNIVNNGNINAHFLLFANTHPEYKAIAICGEKPIGLFGIILYKDPTITRNTNDIINFLFIF